MKRIILAALVGVLVSGLVWATSGNDLQKTCLSEKGDFDNGICLGFIKGITEMIITLRSIGGLTVRFRGICIPEGKFTVGQGADVVKKYLADNPAKRHLSASFLVMAAMRNSFPCNN